MGNQRIKISRTKKRIPPCKRLNKADTTVEINHTCASTVPTTPHSSAMTSITITTPNTNDSTTTSATTTTAQRVRSSSSSTRSTRVTTTKLVPTNSSNTSANGDPATPNTSSNPTINDITSTTSAVSNSNSGTSGNTTVHEPISSSGKKLNRLQNPPASSAQPDDNYRDLSYGLVDLNILKQFINVFTCEKCYGRLETSVKVLSGLAISLEVTCLDPPCHYINTQAMSHTLNSSEGKQVIGLQQTISLTHSG